VEANARTYKEQLLRILDPSKTHVVCNSAWFSTLPLEKLLQLASCVSVARLLSRQDFHERLESEEPLWFHELLYPLCQAYDSVVLEADVEVGGKIRSSTYSLAGIYKDPWGSLLRLSLRFLCSRGWMDASR